MKGHCKQERNTLWIEEGIHRTPRPHLWKGSGVLEKIAQMHRLLLLQCRAEGEG